MDAFWNPAAVAAALRVPSGMEGSRAAEKCSGCEELTHLPTASHAPMLWQQWLPTPAFTVESGQASIQVVLPLE